MRKSVFVIDTEKVRTILALKCWTFEDLAKAAGVSYNTVVNFMNRNRTPYPSTIKKICAALNCEPFELLKIVDNSK